MAYEKELEFARTMARDAGVVMKKYYRTDQHVMYKDSHHRSPVTVADTEINHAVIEAAKNAFPLHGVRGEEESWNADAENLWVVDPIDGTRMYSHHIPVSMFSLAYVENGDVKAAVCFNPWTEDEYTATKGGGAFRNGQPIAVQTDQEISIGVWLQDGEMIQKIWKNDMTPIVIYPMVVKGCLVAEGSLSALFAQPGVGTHDIAATSLLVSEAGGVVMDILGKPQRYDRDVNGTIMGRQDTLTLLKDIL